MASAEPDHEALAALLAGAGRAVALTGLALGQRESADLTGSRSEWARNANLEVFLTEPGRFWRYLYPTASAMAARRPGPGHRALARLQGAGALAALITQGVDRLHQRAGSTDVVEVHGSLLTARCERCGERYGLPEVGDLIDAGPDGVPRCTSPGCGYPLRPEGTLWEEPLPPAAVERAWELAGESDLFIVVDSELRTVPISLLPSVPLTRRVPLVLIGEAPTQYDRYARLLVRGPSEPVLTALAARLAPESG
jgi:NAD-dependent deacetylase